MVDFDATTLTRAHVLNSHFNHKKFDRESSHVYPF